MAFELKRGRGVGSEIRRLLDRQLALAIEQLRGPAPDIGGARRHLKKARALLLLARPALDPLQESPARRLKKASHLLGPLTDAQAAVRTLAALRGYDPRRLPTATIAALRTALVGDAERLTTGLESAWLRARVIRILRRERAQLARASFSRCGVRTTAAALRKAHRRARAARKTVFAAPSGATFHAWRRRTKDEWYLMRLIGDVVNGRLIDDQRRFERLDECLGARHDVDVLQDHVRARSPLPRSQTAAALMAMRAFARDLRRRAAVLADAQDEPASDLETRVLALWLSGEAAAAREVPPWRRRA